MRIDQWVCVVCVCVLVALSGCLGLKEPRTRIAYYTLDYPAPALTDKEPLPAVIKVARFSVAPAYNTHRIIYQDKKFKRDEYYYYKWRSNPGDMITYLLTRDIRESGLFKAVLPHDSRFPFSFTLEGSVDDFLQVETPSSWTARLRVGVVLLKADEPDVVKRILMQKTYTAEAVCKDKRPGGLAEAMSTAMEAVSERILRDIYEALKERLKS